ncbi:Hypothetical protein, putative [Bodo saltans]|uniref:BRCT domain-containing protein n=1 Tax=Bodo saltans TaxID=75058 RepID=A0A0S4JEN5_BODSA|nr:Hypothetical protein, putative [Bodo saltans]|eukprot:CUG88433.1 Hypothetical protein, putative [Bodo saltans]
MSRVMWGVVTKESLRSDEEGKGRHQTTLLQFPSTTFAGGSGISMGAALRRQDVDEPNPRGNVILHKKRQREEEEVANPPSELPAARTTTTVTVARSSKTEQLHQQWLQQQHQHALQDDGIMYGPSGGGNRETQNRRPMMGGAPPPPRVMPNLVATSAAPYSRANIAAVREARQIDGSSSSSSRGGGRTATTEFDEALLEVFLPDVNPEACPRDILRGCCFFLNSCDADPMITTYLLEKLIRRLGGVTSMSAGGVVSYVVTQHLSSAKEIKVVGGGSARRASGAPPPQQKHIHPHWILACAKEGRRVAEAPYLTVRLALGAASSNIANSTGGGGTTASTVAPSRTATSTVSIANDSRGSTKGGGAMSAGGISSSSRGLQGQKNRSLRTSVNSSSGGRVKDSGEVIVID